MVTYYKPFRLIQGSVVKQHFVDSSRSDKSSRCLMVLEPTNYLTAPPGTMLDNWRFSRLGFYFIVAAKEVQLPATTRHRQ